jgi:hypothetical protein
MPEPKRPVNYTLIFFLLFIITAITVVAYIPELRCKIIWDAQVCGITQKEVELITQTDTGEALTGVKIQVIAQGPPEVQYTDNNGYAKVRIPSKGDVRVNLSKSGYPSKDLTINLEIDQNIIRIIRFDRSGSNPNVSPNPSTPSSTPPMTTNKGILLDNVTGNLSVKNEKERHYFALGNPSSVSLYLEDVENEVLITLYTDDGTGSPNYSIDNETATRSQPGKIEKNLKSGKYIVEIQRKVADTRYKLIGINYTEQAKDFGLLENQEKNDKSDLNASNRKKYYRFNIGNPGGVSIYLNEVQNEVLITLCVDDGNGLPAYIIDDDTATRFQPGKIERNLRSGKYIIILSEKGGDTSYSFSIKLVAK